MSITHEQAQKLIQLNLDQVLSMEESATLSAHLRHCRECNSYASEIKEVTNLLPPLMKRRWNVQPAPLSIYSLINKREKLPASILLTMRTAAVSIALMTLFFSARQFVLSSQSRPSRPSVAIPSMPTPASATLQTVSAQLTREGCAILMYTVQEEDTLSSIAEQFSVSEPMIVELNRLESESIHTGMELLIPLCHFTPTGTLETATFTTTRTPVLNFRTSTPGG